MMMKLGDFLEQGSMQIEFTATPDFRIWASRLGSGCTNVS